MGIHKVQRYTAFIRLHLLKIQNLIKRPTLSYLEFSWNTTLFISCLHREVLNFSSTPVLSETRTGTKSTLALTGPETNVEEPLLARWYYLMVCDRNAGTGTWWEKSETSRNKASCERDGEKCSSSNSSRNVFIKPLKKVHYAQIKSKMRLKPFWQWYELWFIWIH